MKFPYAKHLLFTLLFICYSLTIGQRIVTNPTPFYDWDESIYVQVGKEMVKNGSFTPLYRGEPWLEKPPLAPFLYGLATLAPLAPEVSTRLLSLIVSMGVIVLLYILLLRALQSALLATLITAATAINPIFLQRVQVVNTDSFLLLGMLGYLLYHRHAVGGFVFLFTAVMSKSLLGFYPVIILTAYYGLNVYFTRGNKTTHQKARQEAAWFLKTALTQTLILASWYAVMLMLYKSAFITNHFYDHLVRRVTASVESHFGQRTYYLQIFYDQYKDLLYLGVVGLMVFFARLRFPLTQRHLYGAFMLPFYLFLIPVKTKIYWYAYPAVYQIVFFMAYPLTLLTPWRLLFKFFTLLILLSIVAFTVRFGILMQTYSSQTDYQYLAMRASELCARLAVLEDPQSRQTYNNLEAMQLTLTSTTVYGSKPSIIYYSNIPVTIFYNPQLSYPPGACVLAHKEDISAIPAVYPVVERKGDYYLLVTKP